MGISVDAVTERHGHRVMASIQHLSHWTTVGDKTSPNIFDLVVQLSSRHFIYFQWIPSHIGLNSNEIASSLAKSATLLTPLRAMLAQLLMKSSPLKGWN
ncbi:hypothetical protein TNCV_2462921 [Trichonephila clavipes]|nr:hypothetical protein TNCV_2462921 [Trichonephila clavipes]